MAQTVHDKEAHLADTLLWDRLIKRYPLLKTLRSLEDLRKWITQNPTFPLQAEQAWQYKQAAEQSDTLTPPPVAQAAEEQSSQEQQKEKKQVYKIDNRIDPDQALLSESLKETLPQLTITISPTEMQKDVAYQQIQSDIIEQKHNEWIAKHPEKTLADIEMDPDWIAYRDGTHTDPTASSLAKETEQRFRDTHVVDAIRYDQKERMKTYEDPQKDSVYQQFLTQKNAHMATALTKEREQWQKAGKTGEPPTETLKKKLSYQYSAAFAKQFPEKAAHYAQLDENAHLGRVVTHLKREEAILKKKQTPLQMGTQARSVLTHQPAQQTPRPVQVTQIARFIRNPMPPTTQPPPAQNTESPGGPFTQGYHYANRAYSSMQGVRTAFQTARGMGFLGGSTAATGATVAGAEATALAGATVSAPVIAAIITVIFVFLLLILMFIAVQGGNTATPGTPTTATIPGLTMTMSGPDQIANGQSVTYTIQGNYTGSGDVIITNPIPDTAHWADPNGTALPERDPIKWTIKPGETFSHTITLKPKDNDIVLVNKATAGRVGSGMIPISSTSLNDIFAEAAKSRNIPLALLKAIAKTESGVLSYRENEVTTFNTPDWFVGKESEAARKDDNHPLVIRGYAYNTCKYLGNACPKNDVRGAMQFEIATWNGYKKKLQFADGHDPDRRYVRDVIFGAAQLIRDTADQYNSRYGFNNSSDWNEQQVRAMARRYCGGGPEANTNVAACKAGNLTHDDLTWKYYQEFKNQQQ